MTGFTLAIGLLFGLIAGALAVHAWQPVDHWAGFAYDWLRKHW